MFEEAQLYSPVTQREDGKVEVHLGQDHPGFNDPEYRKRRNEIAAAAMAWTPGEPIPHVDYTETEHEIWRVVCRELHDKHEKYACREYLEGKARLALPEDRVPQLSEVTAGLRPLTGFEYHCAPGLVPLREFYGALADRVFHSTQYVRHPSEPLYTPEPDIIHEVIGHGNMLASPRFAEVKRLAGEAARRVETDEALQIIADVFWFTLEFGVIREGSELKAYGAGHPLELRRDRGVPPHRDPPARPRRDERDRVRHHQVPADPLRGRVDGPPRGRRRRLLRHRRRRHAGAPRGRARGRLRAPALATRRRAHHSRSRMLSSSSARVCSTVRPGVSRWSR